ncbi:MAG: flagellar filament capping protein FliD [Clostridia bacterium]|nr:flagellar filament capping protein FliD [Clostridia bacterium]
MATTGPDLGILGIASGLDTQSLIDKIMAFESRPLSLLQGQIAQLKSQQNAWNPLRGLFQSLQDAVLALTEDAGWQPQAASVSDATVLAAAATPDAVPGVYTVQADQAYLAQTGRTDPMARAEIDTSTVTTISDPNAPLGYTGSFSLNGGPAVTLDGTEGLAEIAAKIDDVSAATGVRASVVAVYDQASNQTHEALVLQSLKTGEANGIRYADATTSAGGASLFVGLGILASPTDDRAQAQAVVQAAQDAHFVVNGIPMVSDSNVVSGAIPGVTLTFKNLTATSQVTVSLATDVDQVVKNVKAFVDAFSKLVTTFSQDTSYDPATKTAGPLLGNLDVLLAKSRLGADVQSVVVGAGTYQTLAQVGITQQRDGTLAFDEAAFRAAFESDPASVAALFRGEGGVAQAILAETHRWLDAGGILDSADDSWDARIQDLTEQADRLNDFLAQREALLKTQFQALETAISRMQNQAATLSSLFAQLAANQRAISANG